MTPIARQVTVSVELEPIPHWSSETRMKAYEVRIPGHFGAFTTLGKIERTVESTDRHYGRIRVAGKGRLAWSARSGTRTVGVRCHPNIDAAVSALVMERLEGST